MNKGVKELIGLTGKINAVAGRNQANQQPRQPLYHFSPPLKWHKVNAHTKKITPNAAPQGLSPKTLTAKLATVQLNIKSASFEIVVLFIGKP